MYALVSAFGVRICSSLQQIGCCFTQYPKYMETLGALIDKLSIVNLKLWHCQEALHNDESAQLQSDVKVNLEAKNASLLGQRAKQIDELNDWIQRAVNDPSNMLILNPQNKMYGRFRKDA